MAIRIAILCSDGPHHHFLVRRMSRHFDVALVVVEPGRHQRRRLLNHGRVTDYVWWTYHAWRRCLLGLDSFRRRFFALDDDPSTVQAAAGTDGARQLTVDWINRPRVVTALQAVSPDATVVMGTSILSANTLSAAGAPVLNIHGGYLPDYRGNHCFFFALLDGRVDRIGSTIHLVDRGVDTGAIVSHVVPRVGPDEHPEVLYCRAEKMAVEKMIVLLGGLERGEPLRRQPQPPGGRTFRMRDRRPHHDLAMWFRRQQPRAAPWLWGRKVESLC